MTESELHDILSTAIAADQPEAIRAQLDVLHASELADLLESLPVRDRETVWKLLDITARGEVLAHARDTVRTGLLEQMSPLEIARATVNIDTDDLADILNNLPESTVNQVLMSVDAEKRHQLARVLSYPEDSAGGLMNPDIVSVRADVSLDVVSRYLRALGRLPEQTVNLMVVDRANTYLGVLPLASLLTASPDARVGDFLVSEISFNADTSASDVARAFEQRDLFSAAVVDQEGRLLGGITVDDVLDVIKEQADQTVRHMAGLVDHDMFAPVLSTAGYRAIWLGMNLVTAFLASFVVGRFEETIRQLVALAVLMPVVASMGGVSGSQALNVTIRGLATGQITRLNARSLINKEIGVGIINGALWASVVALVAIWWFENYALGLIIGMAMIINLTIAAFSGVVIPMGLKRLGVDPAIAGGVLLITVTDVVGFATFLGLASIYLWP